MLVRGLMCEKMMIARGLYIVGGGQVARRAKSSLCLKRVAKYRQE